MKNTFFSQHWLAFVLSILIGAVTVAPPLVWRASPEYQGVDMLKTNTETLYLSMINEVIDGHWGLGNPYLFEGKDAPYLFPPVSAYIIGGFGKLLGLSAVNAAFVMRFVLPALIAFLIYWLALQLTGNKLIGLITAPFVLLGYTLAVPGGIAGLFNPSVWSQESMFIDYGRPITPQVSVLFFYLYLVLFWRYLHSDKNEKWFGLASVMALGLSFYTYFYTWTYLFAFNAFVGLLYFWRKDWNKVKKVLAVSVAAVFIGTPYLVRNFGITNDPLYPGLAERFGFVRHRVPIISKTMIGALLVFLAAYRALPQKIKDFFIVIFLTGFFTVNQHLLTGRYFRFDNHHHWYYNRPMAMLLLVTVGFLVIEKLKFTKKFAYGVSAVAIALFIYNGVVVQKVSYAAALPAVRDEQRLAPVIAWLNTETPKDSVVLTENPLRILVPSLTHDNVYYTGGALYTLTPQERVIHSYLVLTYLNHGPDADIRAYFEANREEVSDWLFGYTYRVQPGVCLGCFPNTVIDDLVTRYEKISDENFIDFLKQYRIDYIAWDKKSNPDWRVEERFGLPEVVRFGEVVVYEIT